MPLYALGGLVAWFFPRRRDLWVFGRSTGVGEGPLRLLRVARQEYPQLRLVWIAQNPSQCEEAKRLGLEVHCKSSWRAHWLTLRASVGVMTHGFGDLCRPFVPGMYLVQLWHGSPLKRIQLDAPHTQTAGAQGGVGKVGAWLVRTAFKISSRLISCVASPSPMVSERFKSSWGWQDLSRIRLTGDPRCDVLLEGEPDKRKAKALRRLADIWGIEALPGRLVMFAPTWRDGQKDPTLPRAEALQALQAALSRQDACLVVRSHPWGTLQNEVADVETGRIRFLTSSMLHDVNEVLNAFDVLITDYSAIAMDYSLLQRPIVFLAPDLEAYQRSRGLYESYENFTGGEWSIDWQGAIDRLEAILSNEAALQPGGDNAGTRLARRYHSYADAQSGYRVLHEIAVDKELTRQRRSDAPLEIMHVSGCLGGVETYLQIFASHNDNEKLRLSFVLPEACDLYEYATAQGMPVHTVPMRRPIAPWADLKAALALRRIVRRASPDVVHLHSSKAGLVGRLACVGLGRKVVYTPHAYFYLAKRGLARRIFTWAERVLDRLARSITLGTSPSEERRALEDIGCPRSRVEHILNSVDLEHLSHRRTQPTGGHIVLVARVSEQKNIPMYLRVVRRLRETSNAPCYLVGVGHYEDDRRTLAQMMHASGLVEQDLKIVEWMPRSDLIGLIADAAVVVLTSNYESFGYVLAEANALGIPVVGTDVDGIRDIIRDERNGYLVPAGDAEAMASRVQHLLNHQDAWSAMSAAATEEAARRFDIRQSMPLFEAFYERRTRER
nr:CDP-glycerol glycerophosphotransferase family protein [Dyella mobilis]